MKNTQTKKGKNEVASHSGPVTAKKEWFLVILILIGTFLVFSPVLKGDFVDWDDDENITINPNIGGLSAENIKGIFSSTVTGGYTPLVSLSFAVESEIFGIKPGVYHFNNLMLHLLVTLLVFIFLRKLGINQFVSFTVMILFGIHPMRVESVAWITERKDVLYSLFFFLSLLSYLAFHKSKRIIFYLLALLAFLPALLSKIQAVSLPLILLLIDYFFEKKFLIRHIRNKIPFFILSLVAGVAGVFVLLNEGILDTGTVLPFTQRIFIGTYTLCVYLIKSVVPYQLSALYPYPEKLTWVYYASALVVILLAWLVIKQGKQRKDLIFGTLFFLFTVMFMLQIVGAGQGFMADRFTYLPYIGLFFLIGQGLNTLINSKWKNQVIIAGMIYAGFLGTVTWMRTQVWENTETLFSDVAAKYPEIAVAHNNLGVYYRRQNQNDKAIAAYGKSIELDPAGYVSYNNRGEIYFELGEVDQALKDMNAALALKPDYVKALSNRGAVWGLKQEYNLALKDLDRAISLDPANLSAYSNRILVYYSLGNYERALQDANTYLSIQSDEGDLYNVRGLCLMQLNRNQEALADFNQSVRLNPTAGSYYQNRSTLLYKMGDTKGALKDILKARELGVKVNPSYIQLLQAK